MDYVYSPGGYRRAPLAETKELHSDEETHEHKSIRVRCSSSVRIGNQWLCDTKKRKNVHCDLARQRLDEALVRAVTDENSKIYRNAVIRIQSPEYDFTYTGAAGTARADTDEAMTVGHQFTIASVGKTMTAVVIQQKKKKV